MPVGIYLIALLNVFASKWRYQTRNVGDDVSQLIKMIKDHGITYGSDPEHLSASMKNVKNIIKKRKEQPVTFAEVEGVDVAKAEILKIVSCINKSKDRKDRKLVSKVPKGVLLTGPPRTGKTLLARSLATEVGVSFHVASGTEFVEIFVGTGVARVRELSEKARKSAPSIIFIDEIDAVCGQRGRTLNSEADHTLNQLLIEMDGFYKDDNVVVIAATNILKKLDPTLLRRFTTKVIVGVPDQDGRRKIFGLYMRNVPMQGDKENICEYVASRTEGLVGSDLKEIAEEAERLAEHREGEFVTLDDVRQALDKAEQNNQFVRKTKTKNFLNGRHRTSPHLTAPHLLVTSIFATRHSTGLFLSQKQYAIELLARTHMTNCNPSRTSVDTDSKLGPEGVPVQDPTLYRSLAGGLQYLTFTRPDISYAVQQICLYMHDPHESHLAALKRILRYIRGTLNFGFPLYTSTTISFVGYTNADWAGCPSTRRSTSGYCIFLGDNLLSWSSKRQQTISRSSAEAEYRGVANVVAETAWLRNLLRELHSPLSAATLVYCDNVSATPSPLVAILEPSMYSIYTLHVYRIRQSNNYTIQ
nr:ATPase, AAA-type, core [Tanacetum cinerariifolium]